MFVKWPILRLDDGNRAVHHLQAALDKAGFGCDEDEMRWWMFGDSTQSSLSFFQVRNMPNASLLRDSEVPLSHRALMGNMFK